MLVEEFAYKKWAVKFHSNFTQFEQIFAPLFDPLLLHNPSLAPEVPWFLTGQSFVQNVNGVRNHNSRLL